MMNAIYVANKDGVVNVDNADDDGYRAILT